MKRLFIAINLPEEIKDRIVMLIENVDADIFPNVSKFNSQRISAFGLRKSVSSPRESALWRWLPPENWHLTITFLGYQPEEMVRAAIKSIQECISHSDILQNVRMRNAGEPDGNCGIKIEFDKIILAPPGKAPRMIWLLGAKETSKNIALIKNDMENNLVKNRVKFHRENRPYSAHLTLARLSSISQTNTDLTQTNAEGQSESVLSQRQSAFAFQAKSIDLMESCLKRTGAEHRIIYSAAFR